MKKIAVALTLVLAIFAIGTYSSVTKEGIIKNDIIASAIDITPAHYPDADAVLVDGSLSIRYNADGTYEQWDEQYIKILTERGRQNFSVLTSSFTEPYQREDTCDISLVEVIKPNGIIIAIDVKNASSVMVDPSSMESNIYNPAEKLRQVTIANLESGDLLHCIMHDKTVHPYIEDVWCDIVLFERTYPIKHLRYEVTGPKDAPLNSIALKDEIKGTVITHHDAESSHYTWDAYDVPQVFLEPSMPVPSSTLQRLLVSTAASWEEISRWYWNVSVPHYTTSAALEEQVKNLIATIDNPMEKIESLFYWVAQNIRYAGIIAESVSPGYEPHDVTMTFDEKLGVCRDKAALLVSMLRFADFEAYPVIINSGPKKDAEVPAPFFNHAIACVVIDGRYVLMDPTDEMAKELFPAYLSNTSFLVARPEGEKLLTAPTSPAEDNMMRITTNAFFDNSGTLYADTTFLFEGVNDNAYRNFFAELKPEEIRSYFEERLHDAISSATLKRFALSPSNVLDITTPLSAHISYEAPDVIVDDGKTSIISIPHLGMGVAGSRKGVGVANFLLASNTALEARKFPLLLTMTCGIEEKVITTIEKSMKSLDIPQVFNNIDNKTITWKKNLSHDESHNNSTVIETSTFKIKSLEFSPEEYTTLKKALKIIGHDQRKKLLFTAYDDNSSYANADSLIERCNSDYTLIDKNSWSETTTTTKKILTYSGKKDNSEIKISYNPCWDTVEIVDATVMTSEGTVKKIHKNAISIMDAPWVGSAPRYSPEKLLVLNLPGVDIGSTLSYTVRSTFRERPFFSAVEYFSSYDPVISRNITVTAPATIPLHTLTSDSGFARTESAGTAPLISYERHEEMNSTRFSWSAHDIPGTKDEVASPPWYSYNPSLFCSSGSWKEYSILVTEALTACLDESDEIYALAEKIAEDATSSNEKILSVRNYVDKNIRLIPIAFSDMPLSMLSPAKTTVKDGYGHGADRAILLYTLLNALGCKPEFILASSTPHIDALHTLLSDIPSPLWFDELLVRIPADNGYYYLNDTDHYAVLGSTSHDGHLGLLIADSHFIPIEALEETKEKNSQHYTIALDNTGTATVTVQQSFYGIEYQHMKKIFDEMTPEQIKRSAQNRAASITQSARLVGDILFDFKQYPGTIELTLNAENFAIIDNDYMYFTLPHTLKELFPTAAQKRSNPFMIAKPLMTTITTKIIPPAEFSTTLVPQNATYELPRNAGKVTALSSYERASGSLILEYHGSITPSLFDNEEYNTIRTINNMLSTPRTQTIMLKKDKKQEP